MAGEQNPPKRKLIRVIREMISNRNGAIENFECDYVCDLRDLRIKFWGSKMITGNDYHFVKRELKK